MNEWMQTIAGPGYGPAIFWTLLALGALVLVLIVMRLVRRFSRNGTYYGDETRRPRLAILDATQIDAQRRLVLLRRDGVEHLILIGGPNDLVVEAGIDHARPAVVPAMERRTVPASRPAEPVQPYHPVHAPAVTAAEPPRERHAAPPEPRRQPDEEPIEAAMRREIQGSPAPSIDSPRRSDPPVGEMDSLLSETPSPRR